MAAETCQRRFERKKRKHGAKCRLCRYPGDACDRKSRRQIEDWNIGAGRSWHCRPHCLIYLLAERCGPNAHPAHKSSKNHSGNWQGARTNVVPGWHQDSLHLRSEWKAGCLDKTACRRRARKYDQRHGRRWLATELVS